MSYMALVYFMTAFTLLQMAEDWYLSKDVDYPEGLIMPRRWVVWGTCRSLDTHHDFRYFRLELPMCSYAADYSLGNEGLVWCQKVLVRFAGKWETYWVPV